MDDDYKDPKTYRDPDVDTAKGRNKDTIKWTAYIVAAGVAVPILAAILSFNADDREAALGDAGAVIVASD